MVHGSSRTSEPCPVQHSAGVQASLLVQCFSLAAVILVERMFGPALATQAPAMYRACVQHSGCLRTTAMGILQLAFSATTDPFAYTAALAALFCALSVASAPTLSAVVGAIFELVSERVNREQQDVGGDDGHLAQEPPPPPPPPPPPQQQQQQQQQQQEQGQEQQQLLQEQYILLALLAAATAVVHTNHVPQQAAAVATSQLAGVVCDPEGSNSGSEHDDTNSFGTDSTFCDDCE